MRILENYYISLKGFSPFLFLLLLIQLLFTFLLGSELYTALVVLTMLLYTVIIIIEPFFSFYLVIIITNLIEGKYLEVFVLFRLFGFNWYVMDIVLVSVFLSIFIRYLSGDITFKKNPISRWLTVFLITCFISVFIGIKNGNQTQSVLFDLRVFLYYLIFFPTVFILSDFSKLKKLFYFILSIGTIKCAYDIFLSLFILPNSFDDISLSFLPFARLTGYSEVVYPLTLMTALTFFFFQKQIEKKIMTISIVLISAIALFLSYTRGSWMAVLFATLILLFLFIRSKRLSVNWNILSIITGILFLSLFLLSLLNIISFNVFFERLFSVTYEKIDISNLGRLVEYVTAIEAFLSNPIYGAGFGFFFSYFSPGIGYMSTIYCHNSYLYILSKMGIVGFIPFLMIIIYSLSVGLKILKSKLDIEEISIAFSFVIMLLFLVIKSFTTWHLNTVTFSLFIGLLFGICSIYYNKLKAI